MFLQNNNKLSDSILHPNANCYWLNSKLIILGRMVYVMKRFTDCKQNIN